MAVPSHMDCWLLMPVVSRFVLTLCLENMLETLKVLHPLLCLLKIVHRQQLSGHCHTALGRPRFQRTWTTLLVMMRTLAGRQTNYHCSATLGRSQFHRSGSPLLALMRMDTGRQTKCRCPTALGLHQCSATSLICLVFLKRLQSLPDHPLLQTTHGSTDILTFPYESCREGHVHESVIWIQ